MPDETVGEPSQIIADLQRKLEQRTAELSASTAERDAYRTERDESEAQKTAMAEVLQVINSSPGNLAPVLDMLVQTVARLCRADRVGMYRRRDDAYHLIASHGISEKEFFRAHPLAIDRSTLSGRVAMERRPIHIPDVLQDPEYGYEVQQIAGYRSMLGVPLLRGDQLIGHFNMTRTRVDPFTSKEIELATTFADQAVIAIENARLITETREALEQQTATAEVLGVINTSPGDLAPVFEAMLEKALRLCEAKFGNIATYDGENFHFGATAGHPEFAEWARRNGPGRPEPGTTMDRMLRGERVIHIADMADDEPYRAGTSVRRALVEIGGFRSALAVALRKDDRLLGQLHIYRQEVRPFTDKQIALLQNFAAQAVIAMENARLLGELRQRTEEVGELNRGLEARVAEQVEELGRVGRLKRFLAPQLAELIVSQGDEKILESHRREIVVVFCDIRGFTAFAERVEPEEVMALLSDYHAALGPIVMRYEGTLDHYGGDGIMVFFNDPLPTPEPAKRAIEMAIALREAAAKVVEVWRRDGHDIGFGVGISQGYATLGQIGFAERMDYTAIGTVTNLAARLCQEARDGQILVSRRVARAVADMVKLEEIGEVSLKGLSQAVAVFNVGLAMPQ